MNKQPVSYLQTDKRWKDKPYRVKGETATIGGSGCGPTCAAMVISTLTGKAFTPEDACNWSMAHGYKALNQGTYYSYFRPQLAAYGIECKQLNTANIYGKPNLAVHDEAESLLRDGYYIIACMGKGLWTSSGHFVLVWWADGSVHINDPASTKEARVNGDPATFRSQVKYYWWVDAREHNKEETDMTEEKVKALIAQALQEQKEAQWYPTLSDVPSWYRPSIQKLMDKGILKGSDGGKDGRIETVLDNTLRVDETFCRIVTLLDRAGVFE